LLISIVIEHMRRSVLELQPNPPRSARSHATVEALERLVEAHSHRKHRVAFYAETLGMTADRLNDHIKRCTGVSAGRLIRQRVLAEAKRRLVLTDRAVHQIAEDLAFADPSHFIRFFRLHTGKTPDAFRKQRDATSST